MSSGLGATLVKALTTGGTCVIDIKFCYVEFPDPKYLDNYSESF